MYNNAKIMNNTKMYLIVRNYSEVYATIRFPNQLCSSNTSSMGWKVGQLRWENDVSFNPLDDKGLKSNYGRTEPPSQGKVALLFFSFEINLLLRLSLGKWFSWVHDTGAIINTRRWEGFGAVLQWRDNDLQHLSPWDFSYGLVHASIHNNLKVGSYFVFYIHCINLHNVLFHRAELTSLTQRNYLKTDFQ